MKTVIFAREYRHKLDELREAVFPPNVEIELPDNIYTAAKKAGALKEEKRGGRLSAADRTSDDHSHEGGPSAD